MEPAAAEQAAHRAAAGDMSLEELGRFAKQARASKGQRSLPLAAEVRRWQAEQDRQAAQDRQAKQAEQAEKAKRKLNAGEARKEETALMQGCANTPAAELGGAASWLACLEVASHHAKLSYDPWMKRRSETATRLGFGPALHGYKAAMRRLRRLGAIRSVQPERPGFAIDAVVPKGQRMLAAKAGNKRGDAAPYVWLDAVRKCLRHTVRGLAGRRNGASCKALMVKMAGECEGHKCKVPKVRGLRARYAKFFGYQWRTVNGWLDALLESGVVRDHGDFYSLPMLAAEYKAKADAHKPPNAAVSAADREQAKAARRQRPNALGERPSALGGALSLQSRCQQHPPKRGFGTPCPRRGASPPKAPVRPPKAPEKPSANAKPRPCGRRLPANPRRRGRLRG